MYVFIEWLRRIVLRRRVVVYTAMGKVTYRRPKTNSVAEYQTMMMNWLAVDRPSQKLGDEAQGVVVRTDEIIAVRIY